MELSTNGANLIASFEGFVPHPYQDSVGVWTIGCGTTEINGVHVTSSTHPVTKAQAIALLKQQVQNIYGHAVNELNLPLNQNQFDALCSFTYNVGPGAIGPTMTVGKCLRAHNWRGAADGLLLWDRAGGAVLEGLLHRRQAERALFLKPVKH